MKKRGSAISQAGIVTRKREMELFTTVAGCDDKVDPLWLQRENQLYKKLAQERDAVTNLRTCVFLFSLDSGLPAHFGSHTHNV